MKKTIQLFKYLIHLNLIPAHQNNMQPLNFPFSCKKGLYLFLYSFISCCCIINHLFFSFIYYSYIFCHAFSNFSHFSRSFSVCVCYFNQSKVHLIIVFASLTRICKSLSILYIYFRHSTQCFCDCLYYFGFFALNNKKQKPPYNQVANCMNFICLKFRFLFSDLHHFHFMGIEFLSSLTLCRFHVPQCCQGICEI